MSENSAEGTPTPGPTIAYTFSAPATIAPLPIEISGSPVATVQILPNAGGIILAASGSGSTLKPAQGPVTIGSVIISMDTQPNVIHFGPAPQQQTPTTIATPSVGSSESNTEASIPGSAINSRPSQTQTGVPTGSETPAKKTQDGLSNGAVAGVAIGCLIAGALIAGALVWFCLGRARRRRRDYAASAVALMPREKGLPAKDASLESGSPILAMENGLPQPLEDKAISEGISKISSLVKNHVQSYYHTGRVSPGLVDIDDLQALGHDLPISPGMLSTLLGNSHTREIALRFCIAWVAVSRMQFNCDPNTTFLPPDIARSFQSIAHADRGTRAQALFLSRWRAITAELAQSIYVRNAFTPSDTRNQNIKAAANALDGVLRPFSDSRLSNEERRRNLEEILKRATLFAFTLFSQPSTFEFDWQQEGVKSGSLCVFPALLQVADEAGKPLKQPRSFNEAMVRRLDE